MIPLCSREKISYTADGITWHFKPKIGALEYDAVALFGELAKPEDTKTQMQMVDEFFDRIIIGWSGPGMPDFPESPSTLFSHEEKTELIICWSKANALTEEEKKS
jgi:hypothetical protein